YLRTLDMEERDMTKYIIGTISDLDTPMNPSAKGSRNLSAYLSGITTEMIQKERDEILTAKVEDIRALAGITEAVLEPNHFCVIGNEQKVTEQSALFYEVKNLFA
ncbi:MAG: insulinase family protein, partial [Lachnospiraceae bacterium]|nr:insulinase family protein [Lachnospiraceae bacterium]